MTTLPHALVVNPHGPPGSLPRLLQERPDIAERVEAVFQLLALGELDAAAERAAALMADVEKARAESRGDAGE